MLILLALLFALVVAIFATQNATPVPIRFLIWSFPETSLVLIILGSVLLGAIIVGILGVVKQVSVGIRLREANGKVRRLEEEARTREEKVKGLEEEIIKLKAELLKIRDERKEQSAPVPDQEPPCLP